MKVETLPSGSKRVRVYVPAEKKYKSFTAKTGREARTRQTNTSPRTAARQEKQ